MTTRSRLGRQARGLAFAPREEMTMTAWLVLAVFLLLVTWRVTSKHPRGPKKTEPSSPDSPQR